ncbi:MAG TPA: hypothetical protein VGD60_13000 [Candidatus Acidoferrales bacterium]
MARSEDGTFFGGAGLVWKWQRLLWWIFAINVIFAFFATQGMVDRLTPAISHSAESQAFVHGFDVSQMVSLMGQPDSPLEFQAPTVTHFSVVFMILMLFFTGGIVAAYVRDERPTATTFFEACGHHFWRFLRLLLYMLIVFLPIGGLVAFASHMYDKIDDKSISPFPAVQFFVASAVVILLLMVIVRIWFDMAQVIAVAEDEKRMHKALRLAFGLFRRNFFSLLWLYLRVSIIAVVIVGLCLRLWMLGLKPESTVAAFLLSQFMLLIWIATRLWQRASEAIWYRQNAPVVSPEPVWTPPPVIAPIAMGEPEPYIPPTT